MVERPRYTKHPLGPDRKTIRISRNEMHLAYLNRQKTGEPIQTWIRRLIRENAPPLDGDKPANMSEPR